MSVSWYWYRLQLLHFAASCFQEINKMSVAIVFHGYQDQKDTFLSENYNTMIIWFLIIFGSLYLVTCSRVRINNVWVLSQLSHSVMVILNPLSHEGSRFEKSWVICVLIPFTKNTVPNIIDTSSIPILSWHQHLWRTVWVPFLGLSNTKQTAATFATVIVNIQRLFETPETTQSRWSWKYWISTGILSRARHPKCSVILQSLTVQPHYIQWSCMFGKVTG